MEDHAQVLADLVGEAVQTPPTPSRFRVAVGQDAVEVLPHHHGAGSVAQDPLRMFDPVALLVGEHGPRVHPAR